MIKLDAPNISDSFPNNFWAAICVAQKVKNFRQKVRGFFCGNKWGDFSNERARFSNNKVPTEARSGAARWQHKGAERRVCVSKVYPSLPAGLAQPHCQQGILKKRVSFASQNPRLHPRSQVDIVSIQTVSIRPNVQPAQSLVSSSQALSRQIHVCSRLFFTSRQTVSGRPWVQICSLSRYTAASAAARAHRACQQRALGAEQRRRSWAHQIAHSRCYIH